MNKKGKNLAVLSSAALSALFIGAMTTNVSAAPRDMENLKTKVQYLAEKYSVAPAELDKLLLDLAGEDNFSFEGEDKVKFDFTKLDTFIGQQKKEGKTVTQALQAAKDNKELVLPDKVVTDLKVTSVSDIKKTEVTLKLSDVPAELPAANKFEVKDNNGNVYAATAIAKVAEGEYKLTLGTAVQGKGTLTVKYGNSQASKEFDTTIEGISLKMDIADADSKLVADGADNTIITVTVLKDGQVDTDFNGNVKFQSLKGATFAKETVAFDKGVAKVQLTSISSVETIEDIIRATISDSDDATAKGKAIEATIKYVPGSVPVETEEQVFVTYAEANQTGDIYVKFNKKVNFDKLYADFLANPNVIAVKDSSKALPVNPKDIVKINEDTVKLVLEEANAVNDNDKITVIGRNTDKVKGALLDGEVSFNLVDAKAPEALDAKAPEYRKVVVKFTEAISARTAETPGNWVLNGKKLEAADLVGGKANVGKDGIIYGENEQHQMVDNRAYVTLNLTATGASKLKASGTQNLLQAYNIIDYAGLTDKSGQNVATTQEFTFVTPQPPAAPTATVTMDSPEQYRVKFSSALARQLTAADFGFKYQTDVNADGTSVWGGAVELEDNRTTATKATVTNISGANNDEYLIELNQDWTVKLDTNTTGVNYYAPKHNNVQITVKKANAKNIADVVMAEDKVQVLNMALDAKSPEIAEAKQVIDADKTPLQKVKVTMSEPVQIKNHTKELTPSQKQINDDGIPVPTFQFVNADGSKTIDGELDGTIDAQDMVFTVKPVAGKSLDAGKWTLYIRSISDDIGNTSATTKADVEIQAPKADEIARPIVMWADAHDVEVGHGNDIVHIQFAKEMSLDALKSNIYTINGKILPQGVSITSEEKYYDMNNDGKIDAQDTRKGTMVTITMGADFLSNQEGTHMLNISKSLKDAEGNKIEGETELKLNYDVDGLQNFVHEAPIAAFVDAIKTLTSDNAKLDFTAPNTVTATVEAGKEASLLKDVVKVEDVVKKATALNVSKITINGSDFNLNSTPADIQAAIATLAGKAGNFAGVTLSDLKDREIKVTINGVVTTFKVSL